MPPWRDDLKIALYWTEMTLAELSQATGASQATLRDYLRLHCDEYGCHSTHEDGFPVRRYFYRGETNE
jgi:hypothetical protein